MAITHIQSRAAATQTVTPEVQAFTSSVTAGSLLIAAVYVRGTNAVTVSDNNTNTWQQVGDWTGESPPDSTRFGFLWYAFNAHAGSTTVTSSGAATMDLAIHEFGGIDTVAPLDVFHYQGQNGTAVSTDTCATTKTAEELVFAFGCTRDVLTAGASGDGFTVAVDTSVFDGNQSKYRIVSSLGTYGPATFTSSGSQACWMAIASFASLAPVTLPPFSVVSL